MVDMPRNLKASAEIALSCPQDVMARLCAHFADHGDVAVDGACSRIDTAFGSASMQACQRCLKVFAEGRDETSLAYVKLSIAEHLLHFAAAERPAIVWQGDGAAGQKLPYFREMRVVRSASVTPHMRRLTLAGNDLGRFATGGFHVRLLLPRDDAVPAWPVTGEDGRPAWPEAERRPDVRVYTIRRIDVEKGEVDIDFVLHDGDGMPGARFAANARIGDIVGMTGPGGGDVPSAGWCLLAGDETALPAIGRIVEALPAGVHAVVRIEVADADEEQKLVSQATLDIKWLHRNGVAPGKSALLQNAVRDVPWPEDGRSVFAWVGCEHRSFRAIRSYLRQDRKLERNAHLVVAYWRCGFEGDTARQNDQS
ncbi:NADPH-dependent ferric siderophore reductase [Mesorhizobium tianshanense]|uniref:NADPH-dependent ferric siderophore reductase n=1 Tax=Mesorhizobium tianshanense TaxID=39844 RepID=A0A562NB40_9HYPH|nr:siderophore-interacting protein [Mesorhizobium tianshanense]TWI29320.1 NADPH-dependent ferric siderophore reductase [Mesorhizobium tianshanense]GLS38721.1 NADPH-dependent ferric siderophore reductase [Mesorhizobium tianshanense]